MVKLYLYKLISYYKVGALLHWISFITILIGWFLYGKFDESTVVVFSPGYYLWIFGISFFFFSSYFWRTTFFTPYYTAKVNFLETKKVSVSSQKNQLI